MRLTKKDSSENRSAEKEEAKRWSSMCQALVDYKAKHGHTRVPQSYATVQGKRLGQWVRNLRYKTERELSEERHRQLGEIGFTWRILSSWDEMYKHMLDYKEKNGNCRVPKTYNNENAVRLGKWVLNQRTEYSRRARGLSYHITQEQIDKLEASGFEWFTKERYRVVTTNNESLTDTGDGDGSETETDASSVETAVGRKKRCARTSGGISVGHPISADDSASHEEESSSKRQKYATNEKKQDDVSDDDSNNAHDYPTTVTIHTW
jgi:hypothetical protein